MKKNKSDNKNTLKNYAKYSSIAMQMLVIILLGVFLGIQLDKWISWKFPILTVIFSMFSVILSIYYVTHDFLNKNK